MPTRVSVSPHHHSNLGCPHPQAQWLCLRLEAFRFRDKNCFLALEEKQKYPRHSTGSLSKYHELHSSNVCLTETQQTDSVKEKGCTVSLCLSLLPCPRCPPSSQSLCRTNTRVFAGITGLLSTQKCSVNAVMWLTQICADLFYFEDEIQSKNRLSWATV